MEKLVTKIIITSINIISLFVLTRYGGNSKFAD